jgi:5S rRNA maturation endonuclease (ribonuclease M5)
MRNEKGIRVQQRTPEIDLVLSRLNKVTSSGTGWNAACPCREDDQNPSLTIGIGREGQVLMNCHRGGGCDFTQICESMDLQPTELFPDSKETKPKGKLKLEDTYVYEDSSGSPVMQVLRFREEGGSKTFRQQRREDGEWVWGTQGIDKPLYRLPQVVEQISNNGIIYVVEGEKDVHTLERLGKVATCNPGGAGDEGQNKWLPQHTSTLANAKVVIIQDNDAAGEVHASSVAAELRGAGAKVKVFKPAKGKDISDHVGMGLTLSDLEVITGEIRDEFTDFVETLMGLDHSVPLSQRVNKAKRLLDGFDGDEPSLEEKGRLVEWATLLSEEADDGYDWLIPNLLERQERVIIVAAEGVGKTFLARQVALMSAAGIHPFRRDKMPPIRTLFVDLENPERIIRRTARRIYDRIEVVGKAKEMEANLVIKPDGLDLLKVNDRNKLIEWLDATKPELLVLGPLYKAFLDPGGRTSESVTTEVAKFLDYIRYEYGCALWLEHHAPLGAGTSREMRPFGSAVWSRWSEFGIAITPDPTDPNMMEVKHYRGMRDQREWPTLMRRGNDDEWPFVVLEFSSM